MDYKANRTIELSRYQVTFDLCNPSNQLSHGYHVMSGIFETFSYCNGIRGNIRDAMTSQ